jgi:hypothetical protein
MAVLLTREELHELVWSEPVTKLAAKFKISDVALHKICRKHNSYRNSSCKCAV